MSEEIKGGEKNAIREIEQELRAVKNSLKEIEQDARKYKAEEQKAYEQPKREAAAAQRQQAPMAGTKKLPANVKNEGLKQSRQQLSTEVSLLLNNAKDFMAKLSQDRQMQTDQYLQGLKSYVAHLRKTALEEKLRRLEDLKALHLFNRQTLEEFRDRLEVEGQRGRERRLRELQEIREELDRVLAPFQA